MKDTVRYCILAILAISLCSFTEISKTDTFSVKASAYFEDIQKHAQEKIYLHLNKPYYAVGDTIWIKGYLVNATTHRTDAAIGNFIYIELLNQSDSVIFRNKYRRDNSVFKANIELPIHLQSGEYTLRSYTQWMRNSDPTFFYTRNINIGNAVDVNIISKINYIPAVEQTNKQKIELNFASKEFKSFDNQKVKYEIFDRSGKLITKGNKNCDSNNSIYFELEKKIISNQLRVAVEFISEEMEYKSVTYLPQIETTFACSFFPEGGYLLQNTVQNIAFKCQKNDGWGIEASGVIYNSKGDSLYTIKTTNKGMGLFSFYPEELSGYYAIMKNASTDELRVDLPSIKPKGVSLAISQTKRKIYYDIKSTPTTLWTDTLFLVAHTRGYLMGAIPITKNTSKGELSIDYFADGISHFILMNSEGIPLSERLIFVYPSSIPKWEVTSDKTTRGKREHVSLAILLNTAEGKPLSGDFSLSITDKELVKPDSLSDNIVSNLLLTSDLKGYIEDPGSYFINANRKTLWNMNLLMLTHGWSRFDLSNLNNRMKAPTFFIEKGQYIAGKVTNFFGKGAKNVPVNIISTKVNIVNSLITDSEGNFLTDGIDYKDSVIFIAQARTKKGYDLVDIHIEKDNFPNILAKNLFRDSIAFPKEFMSYSAKRYYMEGGIRIINLKEVVIKSGYATKNKEASDRAWANYSMTATMLASSQGRSALDLFKHAMGGKDIKKHPPLVVIDGMQYDDNLEVLNSIFPEDMLTLDVFRDQSKSSYGSFGKEGPAVVITLKPGAMAKKKRGLIIFNSLGYREAAQFYAPVYDSPEKKGADKSDMRTALHWEPSLKLDSVGKAVISFYTADTPSSYNIEIEGLTKDGAVCRYNGSIMD